MRRNRTARAHRALRRRIFELIDGLLGEIEYQGAPTKEYVNPRTHLARKLLELVKPR